MKRNCEKRVLPNNIDKTKLENYITEKIEGYKKRRDQSNTENNALLSTDYTSRMLSMNNLLVKLQRGDFDVKPEQTKTD
jgi:hypothetical protein